MVKRVFTNDLWLGHEKGKVARCRAWISFPSRSHLVPISFSISFWFLLLLHFPCCDEWAVHSVICCPLVWELTFFGVLHSVRMVWLRLGDVSGWCAEWAVHSVICCRWCESWNELSLCFTPCAHGFVKVWWCQWMCWMSRAQCDLLLVVWVLAMAWDLVLGRWCELRPPPSMNLMP